MAAREHFGYRPALDGLRALAVFAVVFVHLPTRLFEGGQVGVDTFFVLSGFLITSLLLLEHDDTGDVSIRDFYARRIRRLAPALVVVCASVAIAWAIWPDPSVKRETLVGSVISLTYVSAWINAFHITSLGWMSHTWSLSVEEHFYVLWPPLLKRLMRNGTRTVARVAALLFLLSAAEWYIGLALGWSQPRLYFGPDTRAKDVLAGCCLALFLHGKDRVVSARTAQVLGYAGIAILAGFTMLVPETTNGYMAGWPLVAASAVALILAVSTHPELRLSRLLSTPALTWLGKRSYGIYLWSFPFDAWNDGVLTWPKSERLLIAIASIVLTVIAADLSYRFVETPIRAGRRKVSSPQQAETPLT